MPETRFLIVDALGAGKGARRATMDAVGSGPRYVAGVLEHLELDYELVTSAAVLEKPRLLRRFDVLMVSGMTSDLPAVRRVSALWDRHSKGPKVLGGPIASDWVEALKKCRYDLAVIGEGEATLTELLEKGLSDGVLPDRRELRRVRGLAYVEEGEVVFTGLRPFMRRNEYAKLKPSTRAIQGYPGYKALRVYVEVVRGCSNYYRTTMRLPDGRQCTECDACRTGPLSRRYYCPVGIPPGCGYCSVPSLFGPSRSREVQSVLEEVEELVELGVRRVVLSGSDVLDYGRDVLVEPEPLTDPREPPANLDMLEELLSGLHRLVRESKGRFSVMVENIKPNLVDREVAELLGRYLRHTPVNIGCETGSEEHCRALGRPNTPSEALRAVRLLRKAGLRPYVYFMHGLPGESEETTSETVRAIEECRRLGAERIIVYRFRPLPMSAFGDVPSPPPAHVSPLGRAVKEAGERVNRASRKMLVGKRIRAVVYGKAPGRGWIAYPMKHGPVIVVRGFQGEAGEVVEVEVVRMLSDRVVEAVWLKNV